MKKHFTQLILFFSFMSCIPCLAFADNGNTLYYYAKSSTTAKSFSLDDLDKVTFTEDGLKLWKQTGTQEIAFDDFLMFTFTEIEHPIVTNIESKAAERDVLVRYDSGSKTVMVESGCALNGVSIYDLQGRMVANTTTAGSNYHLSLSSVPAGIYLVKAQRDGETIVNKIVR